MVPGPREEAGNEVGLDVQVREVASRYITGQLIEVRLKLCKACEGVCEDDSHRTLEILQKWEWLGNEVGVV